MEAVLLATASRISQSSNLKRPNLIRFPSGIKMFQSPAPKFKAGSKRTTVAISATDRSVAAHSGNSQKAIKQSPPVLSGSIPRQSRSAMRSSEISFRSIRIELKSKQGFLWNRPGINCEPTRDIFENEQG